MNSHTPRGYNSFVVFYRHVQIIQGPTVMSERQTFKNKTIAASEAFNFSQDVLQA